MPLGCDFRAGLSVGFIIITIVLQTMKSLQELAEHLTGLHRQIASAYRPELKSGKLCPACRNNLDNLLTVIGESAVFVADIADSGQQAFDAVQQKSYDRFASRLFKAQDNFMSFAGCKHEL